MANHWHPIRLESLDRFFNGLGTPCVVGDHCHNAGIGNRFLYVLSLKCEFLVGFAGETPIGRKVDEHSATFLDRFSLQFGQRE